MTYVTQNSRSTPGRAFHGERVGFGRRPADGVAGAMDFRFLMFENYSHNDRHYTDANIAYTYETGDYKLNAETGAIEKETKDVGPSMSQASEAMRTR